MFANVATTESTTMNSEVTEVTEAPPNNPFDAAPVVATPSGAGAHALAQREVAEVAAMMGLAKMHPRDPRVAVDRILMACTRESLAEHALYEYAKGGGKIEGPSIRLAEELARQWGNLDTGVVELQRQGNASEVMAYAVDLETLTRKKMQWQVKHYRDTKAGGYWITDERERYENLANVAARRLRACILAILPADVVDVAVNQVKLTLATKVKLTPERIANMVEGFSEYGVTREMIEKRIQRRLDSITPALFTSLARVFTSLKDNMSKPADWFEFEGEAAPTKAGNEGVKQKLAERRAKKEAE
jgi:hypothetical protein